MVEFVVFRCKICTAIILKHPASHSDMPKCPCVIKRGYRLPGTIYRIKEVVQ